MYGLILYYATSMFDHYYKEVTYSRPEAWYFWGYYFAVNFIWMIIPGSMRCFPPKIASADDLTVLLVSSVRTIARAFKALDKMNVALKRLPSGSTNGYANGHANGHANGNMNGWAKKSI